MGDWNNTVARVRRSIHISADPARVWKEFESFDRMQQWWGAVTGPHEAGSGNGQKLIVYEACESGRIEMEVLFQGAPVRYGGRIVAFEPGRELTFECDWIPTQGWAVPTYITIKLTGCLGETLVEILHHGFERTGKNWRDDHAAYEGGWSMTQLRALQSILLTA